MNFLRYLTQVESRKKLYNVNKFRTLPFFCRARHRIGKIPSSTLIVDPILALTRDLDEA